MGSRELAETVLGLSESQRVVLVEKLLDSLSPDAEQDLDEAWEADLDRRYAEFEQTGGGISWDELKNQE